MAAEDSPTKYERIADDLRLDIRSGRYAPGSQLPSKSALRDRYSVSDGPVNKALELLRSEGLAETRQGAGSFVCNPLPEAAASERESVTAKVAAIGEDMEQLQQAVTVIAQRQDMDDSLRERVTKLEVNLMDLYAKLGYQYPHGEANDSGRKPASRRRHGSG